MVYELKHFDTPLIRFSAESGAEPDVHILWTDEDNKQLLPLDLQEISPKGIESWVKNRSKMPCLHSVKQLLTRAKKIRWMCLLATPLCTVLRVL